MRKTGLSFLTGLLLFLASGHAYAQENASNPLAAVSNTDLGFQFFDLDGSNRNDYKDSSLCKQVLYVPKAQGEPMAQPNGVTDDFRRKAVPSIE